MDEGSGSYFGFLLFVCCYAGFVAKGYALLLPAAFIAVAVPVLDLVAGDSRAAADVELSELQGPLVEAAPFLFVVGNTIVVFFAAHLLSAMSFRDRACLVISVGMIGSIGITASHELVHKPSTISKVLGRIGLTNVFYAHLRN